MMICGGADVTTTEIKCTVSGAHLNHPRTISYRTLFHGKCLPWNRSLVPNGLVTAALKDWVCGGEP